MRKRFIALLLSMVLLAGLLPMPVAAVSNGGRDRIEAAVSKMVSDYAKKVYRSDAADDAFGDFFYHGFFGNGRKMVLKESDPMVAALFNAALMKLGLTESITAAVLMMQDMNLEGMYISGGPSWHDFYDTFAYSAYSIATHPKHLPYGQLADGKELVGSNSIQGKLNQNDEVMRLLVGGLSSEMTLKRTAIREGKASYTVQIKLSDRFDFDSDYQAIANSGVDVTKDQRLANLGYLLRYVGLDPFDWSFEKTLQMEVPIICDHSKHAYHIKYDADTMALHADVTNGFSPISGLQLGITENGCYYKLEQTVILRHSNPWVIEYNFDKNQRLMLSPTGSVYGGLTYLYHSGIDYTAASRYLYPDLNDATVSVLDSSFVETRGMYRYNAQHSYIGRMENVIDENGGNMVYVSIIDETMGETVVDAVPMNHHRIRRDLETGLEDLHETTDFLSGTDLMIRYVGLGSFLLSQDLDLYIWENGKNANEDKGTYHAPTCSKTGGYVRICDRCGGEVMSDVIPALGHDYGEYVSDNNAGCVTDGTKTAVCSRCGDKNTVTDPNTALGHSYGEYVSDNNAGCVTDGTETTTCSVCGHKTTRTVVGTAKGHNHISVTVKPTCTEVGYRNHLCRCGDEYQTDKVPALGHTPVTDAAVAATCITKGLTEGSHCEVCDAVIVAQQETATVGHTWDQGVITVEPTPDRGGTIMYTCVHCGVKDYFSVQYTEKLRFEDVNDDDYFADAVAWAAEKNITTGIGEGLFGPNEGCTRGQVVTFLWRAAGEPVPTTTENPFNDVSETDFFYTAVLWAVENGITTGAGEGRFDPDSTCTRGQIVTFLWRSFGKQTAEIDNPFDDVSVGDYYYDAVLWAVDKGITTGVSAESFAPDATCTRGQVVTFLYRANQ